MGSVLVVDDDAGIRESAAMALEKVGHRVTQAADAESAMQVLRDRRVDVVVSDIYMPGEDGLALARAINERRNPPRVILMTARGSIETTALAQKIGAFDYLPKPFDLAELIAAVAAAVAPASDPDMPEPIDPAPPSRMIGSHRSMIEMYKAIARVAPLNVSVVIRGESGSGKELVAHSIHDLSNRAEGPFIALNCGAIPDTLLENELFGSTRGAYTDSRQERRGALLRADGGTLFLDEIGDISPAFQVKLLRFLQDGLVTPLGSEKSIKSDVRVIAASHRDLRKLVADGAFREDLYYRLAGYEISVPAVRERVSDIPLLVEHFRAKVSREMNRELPGPSKPVLDLLMQQPWRGNVRELEQVVRRIAIDSGGLVDASVAAAVLASVATSGSTPTPAGASKESGAAASGDLVSLDEAEKRHIETVLRATAGNRTQAAFILGIERKTLARKMKRLGLIEEQSEEDDEAGES